MKRLTNKQLRGEAGIPDKLIISQIEALHINRRSDGFAIPPIPHGKKGYNRHKKHKNKDE